MPDSDERWMDVVRAGRRAFIDANHPHDMMVIEVHIIPGGFGPGRRIEQIFVGNVSNLADLSDYHVYDNRDPRDGRLNPDAFIGGHARSDGALALTERVVKAILQARSRPGALVAH